MAAPESPVRLLARREPKTRTIVCNRCHRPLKRVECEINFNFEECAARTMVLLICPSGHVQEERPWVAENKALSKLS